MLDNSHGSDQSCCVKKKKKEKRRKKLPPRERERSRARARLDQSGRKEEEEEEEKNTNTRRREPESIRALMGRSGRSAERSTAYPRFAFSRAVRPLLVARPSPPRRRATTTTGIPSRPVVGGMTRGLTSARERASERMLLLLLLALPPLSPAAPARRRRRRPMNIAESSRTINPFLAFYVLNVPRARRSSP